ncbi:MAG: 16S rRNA (guanine(966)-N(2))-methyltransferase RsmD [Candidatus Omnitrophica bacterium]|nr:16S rRNA (guanine(966)-N(2))-methyltransferase RsmD [Candidatus Omnitrophota bacterium]
MIRITTGIYKGRNIRMPSGIRPTQNIARKAIFDILGDINGFTFLELYAGSGAVGIEAASRGAKEVVFVENNIAVLGILEKNLSYLTSTCSQLLSSDALIAIKRLAQENRKFNIIFFDPPYVKEVFPPLRPGLVEAAENSSFAKKTLQTLGAYDILSPAGLIIAQHPKKESLPDHLGVLNLLKLSTYGNSSLSFYQKK